MHAGSAHAPHQHDSTPRRASRAVARQATLHCLTGCAIGEVLGMVLDTSLGLHGAATVALAVVVAFVFGYALTMRGVLRARLPFPAAVRVALAADTVSIAVTEVDDNAVVLTALGRWRPASGASSSGHRWQGRSRWRSSSRFPVTRAPMSRDKGHAVVHGLP